MCSFVSAHHDLEQFVALCFFKWATHFQWYCTQHVTACCGAHGNNEVARHAEIGQQLWQGYVEPYMAEELQQY